MTTLTVPQVDGVFTIRDLDQLPPELRYELYDGKLVIMSPARFWHQHIAGRVRNLLRSAGRVAETEIGVLNTIEDTRVPDIAAFVSEPEDWEVTWHSPTVISLVVEVWSPRSDRKDRDTTWYADRGIPEYWFAEPIETDKRNAMITMYRLERGRDLPAYVATRRATLTDLERDGL